MKLKVATLAILSSTLFLYTYLKAPISFPKPTTTIVSNEEEGELQDERAAWLEQMHRAAPAVNWRQIEYQNAMERHQERREASLFRSDCSIETIADGALRGNWKERGAVNQAGSVYDLEYDSEADEIWLVSAGGTIWKADRLGIEWKVVNQDLIFNPGLLKFVATNDHERRLLALSGRIPHYSDDDGLSWIASSGLPIEDSWGDTKSVVVLEDEEQTIYLLSRKDYWSEIGLFKSTDLGNSFQKIKTFTSNNFDWFRLCKPHHSNEVFLIKRESNGDATLLQIDQNTDNLIELDNQPINLGQARANLIGWASESGIRFYVYARYNANQGDETVKVFQSDDLGQNWEEKGTMPSYPWSVGLYVLPSDPNVLLYGEVNAFRSMDAGNSWDLVNDWSEYYGNECCKLHADIMHFAEFEQNDGLDFQLVSHHGGLSYSENYFQNQNNISLYGLNNSQYYSVRTDPLNSAIVYAGSQDQGFQRSTVFDNMEKAEFDQIISGDYGHVTFTNSGASLWSTYPGGWIIYYEDPQTEGVAGSYTINSEEESVWLPPIMADPLPEQDICYVAGGNVDGGIGSYIIKLEVQDGGIQASNLGIDFRMESGGGTVSALAASPMESNYWYAATTNGRFFYSQDRGESWTQTLNFLPQGNYLYGQAIYASKLSVQTVYLGGSGYSNPAIFKSVDGGQTFDAFATGLPATLVYALTANSDESQFYAATEAGPFVYIVEEERWFDMAGQCAPTQTYWSVEFVEELNTIRFGTYGRGIWDFEIDETVSTEALVEATELKLFPNPSQGLVYFQVENKIGGQKYSVAIYTIDGRKVYSEINTSGRISLEQLDVGVYVFFISDGMQFWSEKLILR